jgi:antitoxin (DNA-binding transcriptional repressor) of toxin-antitoxin stability system
MKDSIVGLKELRENMETYIARVRRGSSFVVIRKAKLIFRIAPADEDDGAWETVVDLTKIRKGGVAACELLKRL